MNSQKNFDQEVSLLADVYRHNNTRTVYQPGDGLPDSGSTTNLTDAEASFLTANIETGHILYFNPSGGVKAGLIRNTIAATSITFLYDPATAIDIAQQYSIENGLSLGAGYPAKCSKVELLLALVKSIYEDVFLTSPFITKIALKKIATYDDLSRRFVFNSKNHRATSTSISLQKNQISYDLIEVA